MLKDRSLTTGDLYCSDCRDNIKFQPKEHLAGLIDSLHEDPKDESIITGLECKTCHKKWVIIEVVRTID
jgi:hypothetical protein